MNKTNWTMEFLIVNRSRNTILNCIKWCFCRCQTYCFDNQTVDKEMRFKLLKEVESCDFRGE